MRNVIRAAGAVLWVGVMLVVAVFPVGADDTGDCQRNANRNPREARMTLTDEGHMQLSLEDRCPVCGMFPAKRPQFAGAMVLDDGRTFYFCANRCLLRAWREADRHLNIAVDAIARMVVLDFFSGAPLDAQTAHWVAGSDVIGPMGPAIIALGTQDDVVRFQARHGGTNIFQLAQMDDTLWAVLSAHRKRPEAHDKKR